MIFKGFAEIQNGRHGTIAIFLKSQRDNYVTPRGGGRVFNRCVTDRSQHNVKKRYKGGKGKGQKSLKKVLRNC